MFNLTRTIQCLSWRKIQPRNLLPVLQCNSPRNANYSVNEIVKSTQRDSSAPRKYIKRGPGLEYFLVNGPQNPTSTANENHKHSKEKHPYISEKSLDGTGKNGNIIPGLISRNTNQFNPAIVFSLHRGLWMSNECQ